MSKMMRMAELDLRGKRVAIREDLNVPMKNAQIISDARILACLPTIRLALDSGAGLILFSHLGRPEEGVYAEEYSLAPVAKRLSEYLKIPVRLEKNYFEGLTISPGEVILCENVRFNLGEKTDNNELGKTYAALCDIFVMDAFGTAHRTQASTHAVAKFAPVVCAGPLLVAELEALSKAYIEAKRPLTAILGGAKISTKLGLLSSLVDKVNTLIIGGGIANNLLLAEGYEIGVSLCEPALIDESRELLMLAQEKGCTMPLPVDVVVGTSLSEKSSATIKDICDVAADEMILDVGPQTSKIYTDLLMQSKTVIWNGPVGCFEIPQFAEGTRQICEAVEKSSAFSLAGGGDTLAAIEKFGAANNMSYLSTGGGAFLEFLEGKTLPAVDILIKRAKGEE